MFIGFACDGCKCSWQDCLKKEERLEGNCKLPYPLLALVAEQSSREHHQLSVTTCLYCLRKAYFQNTEDYYIDPMSMLQATYGTALHKAIEECESIMWLKEHRVKLERDGISIEGTIDAVFEDEDGLHVVDFKFPSSQKYGLSTDQSIKKYVIQVHTYSFMLGNVKKATILLMPTAQRQAQIQSIEVDLDPKMVEESVSYLFSRAKVLNEAYKTRTPPPFDKNDCIRAFCPQSIQAMCGS